MMRPPPGRFAHAVEYAFQVDRDRALEELVLRVGNRGQRHDARVVDQYGERARFLLGRVEKTAYLVRLADVGSDGNRISAALADARDLRTRLLLFTRVVDHDGEAVVGKAFGDRGANAARSARHDGDFSVGAHAKSPVMSYAMLNGRHRLAISTCPRLRLRRAHRGFLREVLGDVEPAKRNIRHCSVATMRQAQGLIAIGRRNAMPVGPIHGKTCAGRGLPIAFAVCDERRPSASSVGVAISYHYRLVG
jgi:hypothetical protein